MVSVTFFSSTNLKKKGLREDKVVLAQGLRGYSSIMAARATARQQRTLHPR